MDDLRTTALDLLRERGHLDAARALEQCGLSLRHVGESSPRRRGEPPEADLFIHAPHHTIDHLHRDFPHGKWFEQVEQAGRDAVAGHARIRNIQWTETEPDELSRLATREPGRSAEGGG